MRLQEPKLPATRELEKREQRREDLPRLGLAAHQVRPTGERTRRQYGADRRHGAVDVERSWSDFNTPPTATPRISSIWARPIGWR